MDKSWMSAGRTSLQYQNGVREFIAYCNSLGDPNNIICPCMSCGNTRTVNAAKLREHLICDGIDPTYRVWVHHGESCPTGENSSGSEPMLGVHKDDFDGPYVSRSVEDAQDDFTVDPHVFQSLVLDAEKPLYPNCAKFTKLSTLVRLFNLKAKHGLSDTCFSDLLKLLKDLLPEDNEIASSMYEAKKSLRALGMCYDKIHACPNNCILFRKDYAELDECPTCKESRWKKKKITKEIMVGTPAKVLMYIPIIPLLKRLFHNSLHAANLTWHSDGRIKDDKLRHPADSLT